MEADGNNWANFIEAVRSRKQSDLNAPDRRRRHLHRRWCTWRTSPTGWAARSTSTRRTTCCTGDKEANAMFTRAYRAPFVVPQKV